MRRRHRRHMALLALRRSRRPRRRGRRGAADQVEERRAVSQLFRRIAAFVRWASWLYFDLDDCADVLDLRPRTLRRWLNQRQEDPQPPPRGRPVETLPKHVRDGLIALLAELGPEVSLRHFERCAPPGISRRELARIHQRYRRAYAWKKGRGLIHALRWERVGTVWAMDHSHPDAPLEQPYRRIFAVRDLASGRVLAADPCRGETAAEAIDTLRRLFALHGPPLLIKSDNGSAFVAVDMAEFLRKHGVTPLFSPPGTPAYNGAVEAGFGAIKARTHTQACLRDHPDYWTCDDIEGGRLAGNELGRSPLTRQLTPDDAWHRRRQVSDDERTAFKEKIDERCTTLLEEQNDVPLPVEVYVRKTLERQAIVATLLECGYLSIRRHRITGTIYPRNRDRFT